MLRPSPLPLLCLLVASGAGTTLVNDAFADGDSQNQDLANHSLRLYNGRTSTSRTDAAGSASFDLTATGASSEAFWAYFTPAGRPITLAPGDRLSVSVSFRLSGFQGNGQDMRWGLLDSKGSRNQANLGGGMNDATFAGDSGYGVQFYASGAGSPFVLGRRSVLASGNPFNNFGDFASLPGNGASARQPLADNILYTLTHTIERTGASTTRLTAEVSGGSLAGLSSSAVETSATPETAFDYFAFRVAGASFATKITFTRLLVEYAPAPPQITSQPQPSRLVSLAGGDAVLAVGATGSQLEYEWRKDGRPLTGNPTCTQPVLELKNLTAADQGEYAVTVSNAGGSVTSDKVVVTVVDDPVSLPPRITAQPRQVLASLGGVARLSLTASGAGLVYQWFRNGAPVPGAAGAELLISAVKLADAGEYRVLVSNSSGSLWSQPILLVVVSPMRVTAISPQSGATGVCPDTVIALTFDLPPRLGSSGWVSVFDSSGALLQAFDIASAPLARPVGGGAFRYHPILIEGSTAYLQLPRPLPLNESFALTMDPGVLTDSSGVPFAGFAPESHHAFSTRAAAPASGASAYTVAADGSGDFCTLQRALDTVPAGNTQPVSITLRPGVYREVIYLASNKPFVSVRGEDRERTIIQYPNNANLNAGNNRAMFGVDAPDFTLEDITLHNTTPKGGSQAEAFRGNNRRILLNRVSLKSFQDTVFLNGAIAILNSYLEGDVDFLWGGGAVYFRNCELNALSPGGYYTQVRNPQEGKGFVFANCRLTSGPGVENVYLSRIDPAAFPFSQVVFVNSAMGPHIHPAGWQLLNSTAAPNIRFLEYGSADLNGAPLNVAARALFSKQITAAEAATLSDPAYVLDGWSPATLNAASESGRPGSAISVDWTAPAGRTPADWIGLYAAGSPDSAPLALQGTGGAAAGRLVFPAPARAGHYEFRYFAAAAPAARAASHRFRTDP